MSVGDFKGPYNFIGLGAAKDPVYMYYLISVSVGPKKTSITNVEKFSLIDFETGKEMFSTRDDMALLLDGGVTNLRSPEIEVYNVICYIFDIFMDHANYYTIN